MFVTKGDVVSWKVSMVVSRTLRFSNFMVSQTFWFCELLQGWFHNLYCDCIVNILVLHLVPRTFGDAKSNMNCDTDFAALFISH